MATVGALLRCLMIFIMDERLTRDSAPAAAPPSRVMSKRTASSRRQIKRQKEIAKTKCGCSATVQIIAKVGR